MRWPLLMMLSVATVVRADDERVTAEKRRKDIEDLLSDKRDTLDPKAICKARTEPSSLDVLMTSITRLQAARKAFDESEEQFRALQADHRCDSSPLTVCLDQDGELLPGGPDGHSSGGHPEVPNKSLTPGDAATVLVLGWASQVDKSRVRVSFVASASNEYLTNAAAQHSSAGDGDARITAKVSETLDKCFDNLAQGLEDAVEAREGPAIVLLVATSTAASATDDFISVVFSRDAAGPPGKSDPSAKAIANQYRLSIDPGRYYVDLGVMVPFTIDRQVRAITDLATGDTRLAIKYDARITPAFVVNAYPGGRVRGRISSTRGGPGENARNWLGVQVGTGLNFATNPFGEFYLGLLITPFSGVNLSVGLALVNEQVLAKGQTEGMLLPQGVTYTPDRRVMIWPYLGFSVTLDFLEVVRAGYARAFGGAKSN